MRKKFFQKLIITSLLFCVVTLVAGGVIFLGKSQCNGAECLLEKKLQGYRKTDVYQNTDRLYGAFFKKDHYQLRAEMWMNIEQTEADNIIKNHTIRMYTLYEMAVSPYPGEISNAISCAQEYRPTYETGQSLGRETHVFTGYANDRLAFGVCADDLITNRAVVVMFYCGHQKRLYKFELFTPINDPVEKFSEETRRIRALSCE